MDKTLAQDRLYNAGQLKDSPGYTYEFLEHMLNIFINHAQRTINEIHVAIAEKDQETIKGAAHRVRPSVNYLHIDTLKDDISLLEKWPGGYGDEFEQLALKVTGTLQVIVQQIRKDIENSHWL